MPARPDLPFEGIVESPYALLPVEEALNIILAHTPVLGTEQVELLQATGRVLAEDIVAQHDLPATPVAAVDGYAVLVDDPSPRREVVAEVGAGWPPGFQLAPGQAAHVMTGAVLPEGTEAVVMVEHVNRQGRWIELLQRPTRGANMAPPGSDIKADQKVLEVGTVLGPAEIGLAAQLGRARLTVFLRPRVAIMATGDELLGPEEPERPGAIRDSNSFSLVSAVLLADAIPIWLGRVRDDEDELRKALLRAFAEADAVVTSGGVSMGTRDLIKPLLQEIGTIHFGRVAIKPGKPLTFGTVHQKLAFGLPGYPVSALVTFEVLVRPALIKMQGRRDIFRPRVEVRLDHDLPRPRDRREYHRAVAFSREGEIWARSTGNQKSSRLLSLAGANALIELDPGEDGIKAGERVRALLVGPLQSLG
jgi:molybdopterin molybdotransferase